MKCKEKDIIVYSRECSKCNRRMYRDGKTCNTLFEEFKKATPSPISPIVKIKGGLPTIKELEETFK